MPHYQYQAVDDSGAKTQGLELADNPYELAVHLKNKGLWLLKSKETKSQKKTACRVKISRRELIDTFSSFSTMLKAGVPLMDVIQSVGQHSDNEGLTQTLESVYKKVESGSSLAKAMAEHPKAFPLQVTSIISAGEQSGQLPETFEEVRKYYEWLDNLMGDIKQASTYPLIVVLVVSLFILILFTFVVPKFADMLTHLGVDLPVITTLVMDISTFTVHYWWLILSVPIALIFITQLMRKKSIAFAEQFDTMKLNLPIFGEINRMIALSRFTHHFSIMFRSGIQILDCLKQCRALVGNAALATIIQKAEKDVSEGLPMSKALEDSQALPPMLLQMIKVGEKTGELDYAMSQVAIYYDEEIPRRVKNVFSIMEPMIMLVLIGIVGAVAIAIFLPIIALLGGVS